jgi:predicted nucleotidyltransferase
MSRSWQDSTGRPAPFVEAIEEIVAYLAGRRGLKSMPLAGSWARGKGVPGADADLVLLHDQEFDRAVLGAHGAKELTG